MPAQDRGLTSAEMDGDCPCRDGMFATRSANRRRWVGRGPRPVNEPNGRGGEGSCRRPVFRRAGRPDQGAGSRSRRGRRLRVTLAVREAVRVRYPTPNENTSWSLTPLAVRPHAGTGAGGTAGGS